MGKALDLTGQRFGRLTVVEMSDKRNSSGKIFWKCRCDCGKECEILGANLRSGHSKSCGCFNKDALKSNAKDLTGQKYGKLTVIKKTNERYYKSVVWQCRCDCGNTVYIPASKLVKGDITNCRSGECSRVKELRGQRFGKLVAVEKTEKRNKAGHIVWKCLCDCGNTCEVNSQNLVLGKTKSCGCSSIEMHQKSSRYDNMTRGETKANTSGRKGVTWRKDRNKWQAQIGITENGIKKTLHLGYYDSFAAAVKARELAEKQYFKPFIDKHEQDMKQGLTDITE